MLHPARVIAIESSKSMVFTANLLAQPKQKRNRIVADQNVITGEIASRYANALYELASEAKSLKKIEKDMKSLETLIVSNADLRGMIANPVFATLDKTTALIAVSKKTKLSPLTTKFVGTVSENRRSDQIVNICWAFIELAASKRGSQIAKVTSAKKLSAPEMSALKAKLKKSLGQKVEIQTSIDPELLGGFVVRVGSRLYDSSLKTKLEDLRITLKEV